MNKAFLLCVAASFLCISCGTTRSASSSRYYPAGEEEVNIGYGTVSAKDNTMAVSTKKISDIDAVVYTSIYDYIRGRVPGVEVGATDSSGNAKVRIRGAASIYADTTPLYIVDGCEVQDLSTVNPNDVYSVDVLKDASATIYGVRGGNGVIMITTKSARQAEFDRMEQKRQMRAAAKAVKRNTK